METFVNRGEICGEHLDCLHDNEVEDAIFAIRRVLFARDAWLIDIDDCDSRYFDWVDMDFSSGGRANLKSLPDIELSHEIEGQVFSEVRSKYYPFLFEIVEVANQVTKYISANDLLNVYNLLYGNISQIDFGDVESTLGTSFKRLNRKRLPCMNIDLDDLISIEISINSSGAVGIRIKDKLGYFSIDGVKGYEVYNSIQKMRERIVIVRSPIGGASALNLVVNEYFAILH